MSTLHLESQILSHFEEIEELIHKKDEHRYNEAIDLINILSAYICNNKSESEIENMINNLELERTTDRTEIASKDIGDDVLKALKNVDLVAYIRFASVYKSFDSLEDFWKFVK